MFDEEDDDELPSAAELTQYTPPGRGTASALDFSAYGEKVDPDSAAAPPRAKGGLDFSSQADPITVPKSPPLPRSRPSDIDTSVSPLDPPPLAIGPEAPDVPLPTPRPDVGSPAGPDYVGGLEDAPFRTGGSALDATLGPDAGMLTGEEAYADQQAKITAAEAALAKAQSERATAKARLDELGYDHGAVVSADPRNVRRALTLAQRRESQATAALQAARAAPPPTQGVARNLGEAAIGTAAQMGADTLTGLRGLSDLIPQPVDFTNPELAKRVKADKRALTEGVDEAAKRAGRPDPARAEEFSTQLTSGAVSMATFMAGGLGARALGASAALGAGGIGAFQMGGQQFAEAEQAIKGLDRRIEATKAQGIDASDLEAKRDLLLKTKYVALFAGMGLGATEAIPVEHFFNRLNQVSKGRVGAILANATVQSMEEMLQEVGQQVGSNTVARLLYDEGRDIFKDVNQSAGVAMVLGGLMGGAAGAVQPRRQDIAVPVQPAIPAPGTSPIEEIFKRAAEVIGESAPQQGTPPDAIIPQAPAQTVEPVTEPPATPTAVVSAIERRVLRKKGYLDDQIDGMSRAEAQAELGEAAQQGVEPETERPSAEPVGDIAAQVKDLQAGGERQAVWLPAATVEHLRSLGKLDEITKAGVVMNDFDGQGGIMVARDRDVAKMARRQRTQGIMDLQAIIGGLTGDGTGKPPGANTVVQQQDAQGNVTRERLVTEDEIAPVSQEFAAPGRTVDVVSGTEALAERAGRVEGESSTGLAEMGSGMAVGITAGLYDRLWAKVEKGDVTDLRKPAALLQAAKMVRDAGGMKTRPEFEAFAKEYAAIERGANFQNDMRALVQRHVPLDFSQHGDAVQGVGTKTSPVKVNDPLDVQRAAEQVTAEPTDAQKEAQNFKMGHIRWPGLGRIISIETAKGGVRTAKDKSWSVPNFPANYGRIKGTKGADGEQIDAFMGEDVNAPQAFIIDQYDPRTGKFDEHKILLGFADQVSAERVYDAAFSDGTGPSRRLSINAVPLKVLKAWMRDGSKRKPFGKPAKPAATNDAKAAVDAALEAAGIPASAVDPADSAKAAQLVAETGVDPGDAFQQVMAAQIEGQTDADQPGAVSESVEGRTEGEATEESELVPGGGETGQDQTSAGDQASGAGALDFSDQADQGDVSEQVGDTDQAKDAGVSGTLADRFVDYFESGETFKNILAARKFAKTAGFSLDAKQIEEQIELAVVKAARKIVADRTDPKANFTALVDLYTRQPKLGTRTSTSMRDQAFSTPVPLAYVASRLAGITPETTTYEPTAGNGALLIEASTDGAKTLANELNKDRAQNLRSQGFFSVDREDAADPMHKPGLKVDRVIANPPFGAVRQEDESKVFDLSDIQNGYKTKEIDHAIALRALVAMKDNGRAVLILGGLNKLIESREARSDAYNGKAKREFYKTLYDRYNVTDHFTVAGELYERQGAGWPVDVIVIDGRGKSKRALPAVDVPRVLSSWDQLGGLLDGLSERSDREADQSADRTSERGSGERDGGVRERGERVSELDTAPGQPGAVQPGPDERAAPAGREGQEPAGDERREPERTGAEPDAERRPPRQLTPEAAIDAALDEAFGPQAGPKSSQATAAPRARTIGEVAKSAAQNVAGSADAAFSGLYELFGGGKTVGSGPVFDLETYAKAKPLFMQAAQKFSAFKDDIGELAKRMVAHMRDTLNWPQEVFQKMRPYLVRFIEEVQSGVVSLTTGEKPKTPTPVKQEQETGTQATYTPSSKTTGLGTLVPINMKVAIAESLADLEKRVGPLDEYVASELGYDKADLETYFAAEQVDALALAIDNLDRGKGFIIGDQTGVGKGRVNAAIIRWAIKKGRVPVFVTEKPNLYKDMFRDLNDIGISDGFLDNAPRILATNSNLSIPLTDEDTGPTLQTSGPKQHSAALIQAGKGKFTDRYDMVFTTYSQMQTVKGDDTVRRAFLEQIAPNATFIFDESHNAGGQGVKGFKPKAGTPANRSGFARDLVERANGVFYSSATYAKRPDVMDLYSATDMVMAVEKKEDLGEAIARGGVPMQQVVASMLAKAGQYIRRERSFSGVTYDTPIVSVNHEQYDGISQTLALIQDFSVVVQEVAKSLDAAIKAEAEAISSDNATGGAGASSVLFTSIMHNIINQMLLAMKAGPVAQIAIEAIKRGEKPVITLANTMESFLSDYAAELDLKPGDVLDADFSRVLQKYLDRTRTLIIKKPFSKDPVQRRYLTDKELGSEGMSSYNRAKAQIESLVLTDLPVSPIDHIKQDLTDAGYKVGEITGRGTIIDYSDPAAPILRNRPGKETSIRGRIDTIKKFNNGDYDIVLLNQSGATGLSLHASATFKDQRKRHMMIAQAEGDINTHMQILGRVHRTGQVVLPTYSQLVADIPAEKRPAAVLAKKMASLNANTTASRGGALTAKDVPDFINEYGDQVAATIIADDFVLNHRLGNAVKIDDNGKITVEDAMRRVTGRIPLLPLKEQEELYERLEADYDALLQQKAAMGENALEAQTLDLKARPLERTEVVKAKSGSNSPFAMPVHIEKTSIVRQGKPFSVAELMDKLGEQLDVTQSDLIDLSPKPKEEQNKAFGEQLADLETRHGTWGRISFDKERDARSDAIKQFTAFQTEQLDAIDPENKDKYEKERLKLNSVKDRWAIIHETLRVGARITLKTVTGNFTSVVLKTERTGETRNPLALSSWKATFALASAERQVTLPFSRLFENGKAPSEDPGAIEIAPIGWIETPAQTIQRFADMQSSLREERFIATGNLLAAYDWLNMKGRIINYTDEQGHIRQGILTAKDFDLVKQFANKARPIRDPAEIVAWLKNHRNQIMWSEDEVVRLTLDMGRLHVSTEAAKRTGGVYFLDKVLIDHLGSDFYKRGPVMTTDLANPSDATMQKIVTRLQALGAVFVDRTEAKPPTTEKIEQAKDEKTRTSITRLTPKAEQSRGDLQAAVLNAIEQVAGPEVARRAMTPDKIITKPGLDWNLKDGQDHEVVGIYYPDREQNNVFPLIQVAMVNSPDALKTAYHEGWHAIEGTLVPAEIDLLRRETARLREYVTRRYPNMAEVIAGAESEEIWAEAAGLYAVGRARGEAGGGIHIAVRRIFEKIMQIMARIRNAMNGMGFRSSKDIFADFASGDMAIRRGALPVEMRERWWEPESAEPKAAIRRRAALPGDVIPAPESVAENWNSGKPFKERLSDVLDAMLLTPTRAIWDRQIDFLRFQKAAEAMSGTVPESMDTYLAASLYPGRVGEQMKDAVRDLWAPVYDAMHKHGVGRDELHNYLYARHAPERNAAIRAIDPGNDEGSGMSDSDAAVIMGSIMGRTADFDTIAALIDKIVEHNRAVMLRDGLESQNTLDNWTNAYDYYVPLKGFEAGTDDELDPSPSSGQGFAVRGPESKRAMGRFDRADDILANLLDQTQRTIVRAEKNKVAKTFLRFAQANPSPFYKIGLGEMRRRINSLTGLVEIYFAVASAHRDEVFAAKVGGKAYYIEIKHRGLLEALKTLGADKMNGLLRVLGRLTREYSRFQTAKNPEFVFTNIMRDLQDAGFTISGEQKARYTRRFMANIVNGKALFGAVLGITEKGASTQYRRWFEEWREAGGKISHYGLKDFEEMRSEIERELNQRTESTGKSIALAAPRMLNPINGKVVKFLEALSDVTESTTRLAVYIAGREVGMTKAQAARMSRNATVDFNRRGVHGTAINALYAFANANIQGNVRLLRTLRKSKVARRAAMGIVVAGMLMTYWNMAVSPEDDEKKRGYEKRKYWERERNIIIYMPGSANAAKIPLGYGLNVFWMMGEQITMRMLGKVGTVEAIGNLLGTMVDAFNPTGSQGSFFDLATWAKGLFPTVLRPIPELALNKNWAGNPIHPSAMPWTEGLPHSDQHKAFTHPAAVNVAEFLNRMSGGNKFEPGVISLYPDDIEYGWNFAVGGLGRFIANTSGTIADYVDGVERPVERMPFVRRFVASDNSPAIQSDTYYKKRREEQVKARRLRAAVRSRSEGTDDGSADAVIERLASETGARPGRNNRGISVPSETIFRAADQQIKALRKEEDTIRKDKELTAVQRRTQIDALRVQMREIMSESRSRVPAPQ